jgi:hypothetical protein
VTIEYVQWVETDESRHHAHLPSLRTTTSVWLRINPPARAWRSKLTDGPPNWTLDVIDKRGQFHTASTWKDCSLFPDIRPEINSNVLLRQVLAPYVQISETSDSADPRHSWIVSKVEFDGKKSHRYDREVIRGNYLVKYVIYADPKTRRLIRKERKEVDLTNRRQVQFTVYDRYVYNKRPPASTFEMPKGKRIVRNHSKDKSTPTWISMSEKDKRNILVTLKRLDQGWRDCNFRKFSSAWKFGTVPKTMSSSEWKRLLQENRNNWSEWTQKLRSVRTLDFVPRRIGRSTFTWSSKRRKTLEIQTELGVTHAATGRSWRGRTELFLQFFRTNRPALRKYSLRVVHWELPPLEILNATKPK